MWHLLAEVAPDVGTMERLLDKFGLPVTLLAICVFALWKIQAKQDYRYDLIVGKCNDLEKEIRAILLNQVTVGNTLMNRLDEHMVRQSKVLEKLAGP